MYIHLVGAWLEAVWTDAKTWRQLRLGPIAVWLRLSRSGPRQSFKFRWKSSPKRLVRQPIERPQSALNLGFETPRQTLGSVLIVGVGRGVGSTAAQFFAARATGVAIVARNATFLEQVQNECADAQARVLAFPADVTNERQMCRTIEDVVEQLGTPDLVIYAVQIAYPGAVLDTEVAALEDSWRSTCLGAFIVAREVGRRMRERGSGTIILTGSSSGLVARAGYLNLAVGKHGVRALAHVMARELGPQGIHVVHCVIDADVNEGELEEGIQMDPEHLAATFLALHRQPRSCWTSELDVRPSKESFWEHC